MATGGTASSPTRVRLQLSTDDGVNVMVFNNAAAFVAYVRESERAGLGHLVERIARGGLVVFPDGTLGLRFRTDGGAR